MARYRGTVGTASRLGHKRNGLKTTLNSWTAGVAVSVHVGERGDVFDISLTTGSSEKPGTKYIGSMYVSEDGVREWRPIGGKVQIL